MKTKFVEILILIYLLVFSCSIKAQNKPDSIIISPKGVYSITSGNVIMSINPMEGGRITSFKLGGYEFLMNKVGNSNGYGATFWPSPQSVWKWPPPAALDNEPYKAESNGKSIEVISGKDSVTGFQFVKKISVNKNNRIKVEYSIINLTDSVKKVAPWEISRAHKGGILFFPIVKNTLGEKYFKPAPVKVVNGICWYQDPKVRPKANELRRAETSKGWMAYAIDGKLFIKKFKAVKPELIAPGEGGVLFYISSNTDFNELEVQGAYKSISPGDKYNWDIEWMAASIPSNIAATVGNNKLVQFVENLVNDN